VAPPQGNSLNRARHSEPRTVLSRNTSTLEHSNACLKYFTALMHLTYVAVCRLPVSRDGWSTRSRAESGIRFALALGADMREGQVSVLPGQHVETEPGGQTKLLCRMNYGLLLVSYLGFRAHQLNKAIWCPDYGLCHQSRTIPLKKNQTRLVLVLPKELRLK